MFPEEWAEPAIYELLSWDLPGNRKGRPRVRTSERIMEPKIRKFPTGATRDVDQEKLDFEGSLSPLVLQRYAEYMKRNCTLPDGSRRPCDDWKKGMPKDSYVKSAWRHFCDWWLEHSAFRSREGIEDAICGLLFNAMGYLHVLLLERRYLQKELNDGKPAGEIEPLG